MSLTRRLTRLEKITVRERVRQTAIGERSYDYLADLTEEEITERLCEIVRVYEAEQGPLTPRPVGKEVAVSEWDTLSLGELVADVKWLLIESGDWKESV